MNELAKVVDAILKLHPDALNELIKFLQVKGSIDTVSDADIKSISLMRDGVELNGEYYFGGSKTMGPNIAAVLKAAKEIGRDEVLELLLDTKGTLDKNPD